MKRTVKVLVCLLVLATMAWAQSITLRMLAYGAKNAYALWLIGEGLPDALGNARFAIEMEKKTPTTEGSAAYVSFVVQNFPVSALIQGTGLSWEHRSDGHCGSRSPRWFASIRGASGASYSLALPCTSATRVPGSAYGWTKASFSAADINSALWQTLGSRTPDALAGQVRYLYVIFDTGPDQGVGFAVLDNIRVNQQVWTGPMDNKP